MCRCGRPLISYCHAPFIRITNGGINCPELLLNIKLRTNLFQYSQRPHLQVPVASNNYRQKINLGGNEPLNNTSLGCCELGPIGGRSREVSKEKLHIFSSEFFFRNCYT